MDSLLIRLPFLLLFLLVLLGWIRFPRRLPPAPDRRRYIALTIISADGIPQPAELEFGSFSAGFEAACDLNLHHFRLSSRGGRLRSDCVDISPSGDGALVVQADRPTMINGVLSRRGRISRGGFLRLEGVKIIFNGIVEREEQHDLPRLRRRNRLLFPAALLLLAAVFVPALVTPGRTQTARTVTRLTDPRGREGTERPALRVIAPGDELPEGMVDILFIHAHPDDESIDFGALLALAAGRGLTTGVVLMTDGESGIYGSGYAGPRGDLAALRVAEAEKALGILRAGYYIRLGLPNHPYNSLEQVLSATQIIERWGGRRKVVARLEEIIARLMPLVVVSPDGPSSAREHFEHETAGLLVGEALERLRTRSGYRPAAHLVSVDPRQRSLYKGLLALPRADVLDLQRRALLSHATQSDAAVFGVEMIEEFEYEYYHIDYWSLHETPTEYLLP